MPFLLRGVGTTEGAAIIFFEDGDGEETNGGRQQVGFAEGAFFVGRLVEVGRRVGRLVGFFIIVGAMVEGDSEGAKLGSSVGIAGFLVGRRVLVGPPEMMPYRPAKKF